MGTSTRLAKSLAAGPLLSLAVTVTSEQCVESVLQSIVQGLASQPGVALARIWLRPSADLPSVCHVVSDPPDCLCLVASAGTPINSPEEDWSFLQGHFARVPFNVGKVGQVAASRHPILVEEVAAQNDWIKRPEWAKREEIRSFAGHPLIFRDKLLGVIAVFSRQYLGQQEFTWLGLFANQAAVAIANACTEEALRSSERNLTAIINTIPTAAWTTCTDGYCDFLNQVWLDYAGMTAEQAQGWGWTAALHPDDRIGLLEYWRSVLASGKRGEIEGRLRRNDGAYRWFLFRAEPFCDENGKVVRWYGTNTDIEDLKQAEYLLAAEKHALEMIADGASLSDILNHVCTSMDLLVAPSMTTILLMDPDGKRLWHIAGPRVPREWVPIVSPLPVALEAGLCGTAAFLKERIVVPDVATDPNWPDRLRPIAIRNGIRAGWSEPIVAKDRQVLGTFALYSPESRVPTDADLALIEGAGRIALIAIERQLAEEALNRARSELAHVTRVTTLNALTASIAHEVNQPLSSIIINASTCRRMLDADPPNIEGARETARRIIRDVNRAGEIITRIRALTKRTATRREKLDLNETISEVLTLIGDEAKRHSVIVRTQFAESIAPIAGDRVQLQQVVLNLVMNAIEAMSSVSKRRRQLVITTQNISADSVQATVEDSGIGIASDTVDKIFDSFYTTKPGGMGMGLSISRSILQSHGGQLWAVSKDAPGTMFHFTIPKYREEGQHARATGN